MIPAPSGAQPDAAERAPGRRSDGADLGRLYEDLRRLARHYLVGERRDHTLQTTALVHEAYLRLARTSCPQEDDRGFIFQAARAMRAVLVDHARRRSAGKRLASGRRVPLDDAVRTCENRLLDLVALDEALHRLHAVDPELTRIVELRFFAGLSEAEVATVCAMSTRSVRRAWRVARLWLAQELSR